MYKKLLLFSALAAATINDLHAQSSKDFRTYGTTNYETVAGVVTDSLGNNVLFGTYQGTLNAGNNIVLQSQRSALDFFLIKRDSTGQTIWAKTFGANDTITNMAWYADYASDLTLDKNGNIYLLGEVNCSADIVFGSITLADAQTPTAKNVFVSQFDKNGVCKWITINKTNPNAAPSRIVVDDKKRTSITGGAYGSEVFGTYTLSTSGNYIAMFDSTGTALWAKSYNANIKGLAPDKNGYVYCAGMTTANQFGGTAITLKGNTDLVVAKIDSSGALSWVKNEGAPGNTLNGYNIEQHNNQVYVIASHTSSLSIAAASFTNGNRFFLLAYDAQGTMQWARGTDVASNWGNPGNCDIALNKKGELFMLVNSSSSFVFGTSSVNAPGVSGIILKYNAAGLPDWGITYASTVNYGSNTSKIGCDNYNHLFVAGNFSGSMAIAGSATLNALGSGNYDAFAAILDVKNLTVGFKELANGQNLLLFPNPASNILYLDIKNTGSAYNYLITDQLGRTVSRNTLGTAHTIDISELSAGVYFMEIKPVEDNRSVAFKKFMIER